MPPTQLKAQLRGPRAQPRGAEPHSRLRPQEFGKRLRLSTTVLLPGLLGGISVATAN